MDTQVIYEPNPKHINFHPVTGSHEPKNVIEEALVKRMSLVAEPADNRIRLICHVELRKETLPIASLHSQGDNYCLNGQQAIQLGQWLIEWGKQIKSK